MKRGLFLTVILLAAAMAQAFPPIPKVSAKALGATKGKPFTEGLVFVNGKFIPPPYVVERWGTGIRINKIPVTGQIVPWSEFLKTQKDVVVETSATPPAEFSEPLPNEVPSEEPQPEKESVPTPKEDREEPSGGSSSLDDLFGAAEPSEANVVFVDREIASPEDFGTVTDVNGHEVTKLDSLKKRELSDDEDDDESEGGEAADKGEWGKGRSEIAASEPDESAPQAEPESEASQEEASKAETPKPKAKPKKAPPPAKPKTRMVLKGAFVKNTASQMLVSKINAQRAEIDRTLRSGGFLCFGDRYARISGDRAAMSRLLSALPEIQMKSETFEDFCAAVRAANLLYLHEPACDDLFVHRIDYRALQEYRAKLRKDREWKKMMEGAQPLF